MNKKTLVIGIVVIVLAGAGIFLFGNQKPPVSEEVAKIETVLVQQVSDLAGAEAPLVAYGTVVASDSVDVVPEISGVVARINKRLGDSVQAGDVVVELQNTTQRQAVLQAQAAAAISNAQYTQVKNGADIEDIQNQETDVLNKKTTLDQTIITSKQTANNLLISTINSIEDAFDQYFDDPKTDPKLLFSNSNFSDTQKIQTTRIGLNMAIKEAEAKIQSAPNTEAGAKSAFDAVTKLTTAYTTAVNEMSVITEEQPTSRTSQDEKDTRQENLRSIKQTLVGIDGQLSSARLVLDGAASAYAIAQTNLERLRDGADKEDLSIAQGGVLSAQAQLASAQLGLEKTYIKAPTSGKISAMTATPGQLAGQAPLFTVASSGIKRVDVYISSQEVDQVVVGATATIDETFEGRVTRISPSIDDTTGKVKVEILVTSPTEGLVEGAGVGAAINSANKVQVGFTIPIEAVFVEDEVSYVYVVNPSNILEKKQIQTQGLYGSNVVVTGGLFADDSLVLLARGLKEGQTVTPQTK